MHALTTLAALATFLAPLVNAHYAFTRLIVNGQPQGNEWQYVRHHDRSYQPTWPDEAATSPEFRCNKGAGSGANTGVFTVRPGDRVGLLQGNGAGGMFHPGPVQIYMSRAPNGNVKNYDGSGEWFKVYQSLMCSNGKEWIRDKGWCSWGENNLSFTMPNLPDGEYLVRGEHMPLHKAFQGLAEFYYSCAQIKLVGGSATAIPGQKVRIPGVYRKEDPALNYGIYIPNNYPYTPGPAVIPGGQIRGNADGSSGGTRVV